MENSDQPPSFPDLPPQSENLIDSVEEDESFAKKCQHSSTALLLPLIHGLFFGSDSKWTWTSFHIWTQFFIGRKPDAQRVVACLIIWSILAFILAIIFFTLFDGTVILYIGLYYLFNACLLFLFHFNSLCKRNVDAYQSIW